MTEIDKAQLAADAIADLGADPTPAEVLKATRVYDARSLAAAAGSSAAGAGSPGGSLPDGGTTGQVLTKASDADGDADWETGGGSQPVGCALLLNQPIDITDQGVYYATWDLVVDNIPDENELEALPEGIGLSGFGADTLTTTEEGVWAFTTLGWYFPVDATWEGALVFGNYNSGPDIGYPVLTSAGATGGRGVCFSQVLKWPSGESFSLGIRTDTGATTDPFSVQPQMIVVRLA